MATTAEMAEQVDKIVNNGNFKSAMNQLIFSLPANKMASLAMVLHEKLMNDTEEVDIIRKHEIDFSQHRRLNRLVKLIEVFLKRILEQRMIASTFQFENDNLTDKDLEVIQTIASLVCFASKGSECFSKLFLQTCKSNFEDFPGYFWSQLFEYLVIYRSVDVLDWFNYGCQFENYHQLLITMLFEARKHGLVVRPLDFNSSFFGNCYSSEDFEEASEKRITPIEISISKSYSRGIRVMVNDKFYSSVMSVFGKYLRFLCRLKSAHREIRKFAENLSLSKIERRWRSIRREVTRGIREHRPHRIGIRWQPFVETGLTSLEIWRDEDVVNYPGVRLRFKEDFLIYKKDFDMALVDGFINGLDSLIESRPGKIDYDVALVANWLVLGVYGMIVSNPVSQSNNRNDRNGDEVLINHLDHCYEVVEIEVSAHLRLLPDNRQVGEDRAKLCRRLLGIELPDGYTVVRPYRKNVYSNQSREGKLDMYVNCPEDPDQVI